jgi:hypothetical protein
MSKEQISRFPGPGGDSLVAAMLFGLALVVFLLTPIHDVTDSAYSMLASESLLKHRTFTLDQYALPRYAPKYWVDYVSNGPLYTVELNNGHLYYFFPPGNQVLSAPFVAVLNAFGVSAANADGTYNPEGETTIEYVLAAFLMAGLTVIFFYTGRLVLSLKWSIVVALFGAFGTQIFSTASRVLWTDTWGTFLLGLTLWMIMRRETRKGELQGVVLGTLLAWLYFVRPTFSVHIIAITIYVLLCQRKYFVQCVTTGAVWLALFCWYSWHNFHHLLPSYYRASRLYFGVFWTALAANIVSPGRGLLVYVPVLFFIGYLLVRYRKQMRYPRIVVMALCVVVVHLAIISCFGHWWGGYSYGPRFSTGLVPWFVILAILGLQGRNISLEKRIPLASLTARALELSLGSVLLIVSIAINALGAADRNTTYWNVRPQNIDLHPERNWDWRQPQFLAGFLHPPFPDVVPGLLDQQAILLDATKAVSDQWFWYGWSPAESQFRWTDGHAATLVFALAHHRAIQMTVKAGGFIVPGHQRQRVMVSLNEATVGNFEIVDERSGEYQIQLPANVLRDQNVLTFNLPDAASPEALGLSKDPRELGLALYWIKFTGPIEQPVP